MTRTTKNWETSIETDPQISRFNDNFVDYFIDDRFPQKNK